MAVEVRQQAHTWVCHWSLLSHITAGKAHNHRHFHSTRKRPATRKIIMNVTGPLMELSLITRVVCQQEYHRLCWGAGVIFSWTVSSLLDKARLSIFIGKDKIGRSMYTGECSRQAVYSRKCSYIYMFVYMYIIILRDFLYLLHAHTHVCTWIVNAYRINVTTVSLNVCVPERAREYIYMSDFLYACALAGSYFWQP